MLKIKILSLVAGIALATSSGCNLTGFMDAPSGDAQILAAARACFDRQDYTCALELYGRASGTGDQATSETAMVIMEQAGMGMVDFMGAIGAGGAGGTIINSLTRAASTKSPSKATRIAIFQAYKKVALISNGSLKGMVRFIVASSLLGELLAEIAPAGQTLRKTDLVTNASSCISAGNPLCAVPGDTTCDGPTLGGTAFTLDDANAETLLGADTVNLSMVHAAIQAISTALGSTELGGSGSFAQGSSAFSGDMLNAEIGGNAITPPTFPDCYRHFLLLLGIGE